MNVKSLLLAFFLGAFLAGGIGYLVVRSTQNVGGTDLARDSAATGDAAGGARREGASGTDSSGDGPAEDATLKGSPRAAEHLADLERENEVLEAQVTELLEKIDALQPKPRDPKAFRFGLPQAAPSFDGADWPKLAENVGNLRPLLRELRDAFAEGRSPGPKWQASVQKHNMPLATFAIKVNADLADEKMANANAAYTHPAVFANLMRATLTTAKLPLTADQEIAIQALGDAWAREKQRAEAAIPVGAPALKYTVEDVDAKQRFLNSVKSVLTAQQLQVLFSPETEGRMHLDLLSPVLVYSPVSVPLDANDRLDMEKKLLTQLLETTGMETEDVSKYAWIGREWVDAIPGATDPQVVTAVEFRCPHVDVVQTRARAQVQATERILAMGGLSEKQAAALRAVNVLLYPFILQKGS